MAYIPDIHFQASLQFERYLKNLCARAKMMELILCDGRSSDAHVQACRNLVSWARENRHLEALSGKILSEIADRYKLKAHDVRASSDIALARWFEQYHDAFIGVYEIALAELKERYEEFAKIAERERKRTQAALKESA